MTKRAINDRRNVHTVVVLGAGMAGLAAARVLSERCEQVIVLERDVLPDGPEPRRLVPQGQHPHLLLPTGARLLEAWFPGLGQELTSAGAVELDMCADFHWHQRGGVQRRPASMLRGPTMSRPLLEWCVRRRVAALPSVEIRDNTTVAGLVADLDRGRICGVQLEGGAEVPAELVVDATGRHARTVGWLQDLGYNPPRTSVVEIDTRYASRVFHRLREPERDWQAAAVLCDPSQKKLAMALPMEGDRWIVAFCGLNGEAAPTDGAALLEYARAFDSPVIADVLARSDPVGAVATHRFPANQRRHVERLRRFPIGWVLVGDSLCSFDPIYGQGMTSAALQAEALGAALDRTGTVDRSLTRAYFRAAARIVSVPWSIAVGGDFAYPGTTGNKPFATDLLNRYMDRVIDAGKVDDDVVIRLNEVAALVRSPTALLAPSFALRVLRAARRADRGTDSVERASAGRTTAPTAPARHYTRGGRTEVPIGR
jgi:2-polyprenyl-6-methoxyphenol hydroxylase-like FAD-dependent oxidoreductase